MTGTSRQISGFRPNAILVMLASNCWVLFVESIASHFFRAGEQKIRNGWQSLWRHSLLQPVVRKRETKPTQRRDATLKTAREQKEPNNSRRWLRQRPQQATPFDCKYNIVVAGCVNFASSNSRKLTAATISDGASSTAATAIHHQFQFQQQQQQQQSHHNHHGPNNDIHDSQ